MGGSIGSKFINNAVWESLDNLLNDFQIIHLVGKGNINKDLIGKVGYQQYEFISEQLNDVFAMTDLMISRAGANSICEILALKIPNILIPLSAAASRGDQILNAESYKKQGFSTVLQEEELTSQILIDAVKDVNNRKDAIKETMSSSHLLDANSTILDLITDINK